MSDKEFVSRAEKLLDRIDSLQLRIHSPRQPEQFSFRSPQLGVAARRPPPPKYSLDQLAGVEEALLSNGEQNSRGLRRLGQQIRRIQQVMNEEAASRAKISEGLLLTVGKLQKKLSSAMESIQKIFSQREAKLQAKIEHTLRYYRRLLSEHISENSISNSVAGMAEIIKILGRQVEDMRVARNQLEDRITKQFTAQISELRRVFAGELKAREQRELQLLQVLRNLHKRHAELLRKQEIERQAAEKMFLTILEQLVKKIHEA